MINTYKNYKTLNTYKSFLESLLDNTNSSLLTTIISGVNIIMEGAFTNEYLGDDQLDKYMNRPSEKEYRSLIENKKFDIIKKYAYGNMIRLIDEKYPNESDIDKAEALYTACISYIKENTYVLAKFDPHYNFDRYINDFIIRPAKSNVTYIENKNNNTIDADGIPDTIDDTDTWHIVDTYGKEISTDVQDAINVIVEVYTEKRGEEQADNIRKLLNDAFNGIAGKLIRPVITRDINSLQQNWKRIKEPDKRKEASQVANTKIEQLNKELAKIDDILSDTIGSSKFGAKYGFKNTQAKELWSDFIDVLKHQPSVIRWMGEQRKIAEETTPIETELEEEPVETEKA